MLMNQSEPRVTFADVALSHTEKRWEKHWLKKVLELVNWQPFRKRLEKLYARGMGRPAWEPILLFRCLLLAQWYGLSDRQLEEAIEFRIDFRKFVGLPFDQEAPDATTFVEFRKRIQPISPRLMEIMTKQLENAGFKIKHAVSVDATLVESHSRPKGGEGGDEDADWRGFPPKIIANEQGQKTIARRPALHGYKIHLTSTVGMGLVTGCLVTAASVHESQHMEDIIDPDTGKVYGDKGYYGCKKALAERGIEDGIQDKGFRNRPLTAAQIRRNKGITKQRRIVEGVFGSWKQWYRWRKTRYMGLARNQLAVILTALSWNMKKWAYAS